MSSILAYLTRALVGSFYNAIWWGGGAIFSPPPPRISGTTGPIYKTQAAFDSPGQFIEQKIKNVDLGVTDDVTGQVKVKMFDHSLWMGSARKISTLNAWEADILI